MLHIAGFGTTQGIEWYSKRTHNMVTGIDNRVPGKQLMTAEFQQLRLP